ncbi:TlpA family protein disulfide reductase [Acidobacteria bacterium AH-259-A15]|nr:TlpA family protein disulfide reductase [Acidobacteria bacterium AH-259-A15]
MALQRLNFLQKALQGSVPLILGILFILSCGELPEPPGDTPWLAVHERQQIDLSGTFKTVDGKQVSLADLQQDKVLFLNVWATWCGPCRVEMPSMASLYEELYDEGLTMVAVSEEDTQTVRQYLQEQPYPFTILLDTENILSQRFEIYALPTTFIVDNQGRLALRHAGAYEWDSPVMIEQFRRLVAQ